MKNKLIILVACLLNTTSFAANVSITGSIPASVALHNNESNLALSTPAVKQISLLKINLSEEAKKYLAAKANQPVSLRSVPASTSLPPVTQLDMNGVPVLDQGVHGTCVTFADTAALDAVLGHTDYISQLCNLTLGAFLASQDSSYASGWDGTWSKQVLAQIRQYGVINTAYQQQYGCGSTSLLTAYPVNSYYTGSPMPADQFTKHSELIMNDIYSRPILNVEDAFTPKTDMDDVLSKTKSALSNGNRVVIGTLLDVNGSLEQVNGADGSYQNAKHDAWIMTPAIRKDLAEQTVNAGHAMVITGYDDQAVITGSDGSKHQGVITLRNSWSAKAGFRGNYYMSYEYFKLMVVEVVEISATPV